MNVYLVGYRCTGKSSVGRRLAERLGWAFKDADHELVEVYGKSIAGIVESEGWEGFRKKEAEITRSLAELDRHVIATGGGVVLNPSNIRCMKRNGVVVWMTATIHTIAGRMAGDESSKEFRPSLTGGKIQKEIEQTLAERIPLYEAAMDFKVETDGIGVDQICSRVEEKLRTLKMTDRDRPIIGSRDFQDSIDKGIVKNH